MYHPLCRVERVDYPIVAYAQAVTTAAGQMVMREPGKPQSHFVNLTFDPRLNQRRQFEERGVEARVVDLERRAHPKSSRLPHSRLKSPTHLALRLWDGRFKLWGNLHFVLD